MFSLPETSDLLPVEEVGESEGRDKCVADDIPHLDGLVGGTRDHLRSVSVPTDGSHVLQKLGGEGTAFAQMTR